MLATRDYDNDIEFFGLVFYYCFCFVFWRWIMEEHIVLSVIDHPSLIKMNY